MSEIWLDWKLKELDKTERGRGGWRKYLLNEKGIIVEDCLNDEEIRKKILEIWSDRFRNEDVAFNRKKGMCSMV